METRRVTPVTGRAEGRDLELSHMTAAGRKRLGESKERKKIMLRKTPYLRSNDGEEVD